jgi:streptogramin lyase
VFNSVPVPALLLALPLGGALAIAQTIDEYAILGLPRGIAAGPDGNLWFADEEGRIGRITTQGVVTEFPVPGTSTRPNSITAGPDEAMWFTEATANKIGRVNVAPPSCGTGRDRVQTLAPAAGLPCVSSRP